MQIFGIFLIALAACCAIAVIYPYVLYPQFLKLVPKAQSPEAHDVAPTAGNIAILFSAFNEAGTAPAKVENLRRLLDRHPDLEILIYDDGSTDRTREIYSELGDGIIIAGSGRTGKATGMARLVSATVRPILLFTDANVLLAEDLIDKVAQYFSNPDVGGVCGHLRYEASEKTATQAAGGAYWRLEESIKRLESRTGSVMGGDGSIFVMRRSLYPNVPATAQDDFTATMSVVFNGSRLIKADDVIVYERLVAKSRDEYRRKVRIAARAIHTHMCMRRDIRQMSLINRWKYSSHKIMRWYGAFFLCAGLIAGLAGFALLHPLVGLSGLVTTGAVALSIAFIPRLGTIRETVVAIIATGHGVVLALFGKTFATWTPPQSR